MKRNTIFVIVIIFIAVIFIMNFLFHYFYFSNINKNVKPVTEEQKQKIIKIVDEKGLNSSDIIFREACSRGKTEFVRIELNDGNSRSEYIINLKNERIVKR